MKNKTLIIVLTIGGILILAGFAVFKLYTLNQEAKANLPYLLIGEKIEYFDLLDENAGPINVSAFDGDRPALIFIFSRPCSPCNKNIVYWRKMVEILKDEVNFYGIILDNPTQAFNFSDEAQLNFKIYVPRDLDKFILKQRIKLNYSQTILYSGNKVRYLKLGPLEGDEAVNIINMTKKRIRR
jgi:hypothetical protein